MSTIKDRLDTIKTRINSATQDEARNEFIRERSREELRESLQRLQDEFSVSTVEEAQELRDSLEKSLLESTEKIEKALDALVS